MKKLILIPTMLALVAAGAFATGEEEGSAAAPTLVYWTDNPNLTSDAAIYAIVLEEAQVQLDVTGIPEESYGDKLQLAAAAGDMPDVMGRIIDSTVRPLGYDGFLMPLRDITMEKVPNLWQAIESRGLNIAAHSGLFGDGTGEFWMAPRFGYNGICNAASYRVDVLEAVGMEPPTTTEELREVTMAIKAEFPDMIPIMTRASWATLMWFNEMFGIKFAPMGRVEEATDAYRDMLRYLAGLYRDGLIDQEWVTGSEEQLKQAFNAGRVAFEYGFGAFSMPGRIGAFMAENGITAEDHAASSESEAAAKAYAARYHEVIGFLDPITVNPGDKVVPSCITNTRGGFEDSGLSVSTTVADEDAAMRLLNWVYQPDASGHHTGGWGKKGVGWDFDAEGVGRALPSKDPDFIGEAAFRMMPDVGRVSSNALYQTLAAMDRRVADRAFLETRDVIAFADDRDRQRHNDLRAQINPIIGEWRARFATGQADVDSQWDEYIAELKKAGLEEYEQLKQDNLVEGVPHMQPLSQFLN